MAGQSEVIVEAVITNRKVILDDDCEKFVPRLVTVPVRGNVVVLIYKDSLVGNRAGHPVSFAHYLMGADFRRGEFVVFRNGDTLDVRRENLQIVDRGYINRNRRITKWKGISHIQGRIHVSVYLDEKRKITITLDESEGDKKAAWLYDAMCNYLGIDGYRNFKDEEAVLPEGYRERIKRRYEELTK